MLSSMFTGAAALVGLAAALPSTPAVPDILSKRTFDCSVPVAGLLQADCEYLSQIGVFSQGANPTASPGYNGIWIGGDGPNTFTFTNSASAGAGPVGSAILIVWVQIQGNYLSSFMNSVQAAVTYSLPNPGDSVTISLGDGVSGGASYVRNGVTHMSQYGQIGNTWLEFTSGQYATVDVSREVEMLGLPISAQVQNSGCVTDMNYCVFKCSDGVESCQDGFHLWNCDPNVIPGASFGQDPYTKAPSGGCTGWSSNGRISVGLGEGYLVPDGAEPYYPTSDTPTI